MSDVAIDCIKKELDDAYKSAIDNFGVAISDLRLLKKALEQAREGNSQEGPPICYKQHQDVAELCRSRIFILERLLEEIDFERKMESDTSGCTTPLKIWRKDHPS